MNTGFWVVGQWLSEAWKWETGMSAMAVIEYQSNGDLHYSFPIALNTLHIQCSGVIPLRLNACISHVLTGSTDRGMCVQFTAILLNKLLFQHQCPPWQTDVDFLLLCLHCWESLTWQRKSTFWTVGETAMLCQCLRVHISHPFYLKQTTILPFQTGFVELLKLS